MRVVINSASNIKSRMGTIQLAVFTLSGFDTAIGDRDPYRGAIAIAPSYVKKGTHGKSVTQMNSGSLANKLNGRARICKTWRAARLFEDRPGFYLNVLAWDSTD